MDTSPEAQESIPLTEHQKIVAQFNANHSEGFVKTPIPEDTPLEPNKPLTPKELDERLKPENARIYRSRMLALQTNIENGKEVQIARFDYVGDNCIKVNYSPDAKNEPQEQPFYMASTPKAIFMDELGQAMHEQGLTVEDPLFEIGFGVISELAGRGQINEFFKRLSVYKSIPDNLRRMINTKSFNKEELEKIKINVNFKDLCWMNLTVSANTSVGVARNFVIEHLVQKQEKETGVKIPQNERYALGFKLLTEKVNKYAPSVEFTNFATDFWQQKGPNTAQPANMLYAYDKIIAKGISSKPNVFQTTIVEAMKSNKINYGFDLSTTLSEIKSLNKAGWKIFEKTGLYPCVFWTQNQAEAGMPPHMLITSVLTLVDKNGRRFTVLNIMEVEVELPNQTNERGDPDEETEEYRKYSDKVLAIFGDPFRQQGIINLSRIIPEINLAELIKEEEEDKKDLSKYKLQ